MATHSVKTLSNASASRVSPSGVHSGVDLTVQNIHETAYVYLGSAAVTSSNFGYRLAPGAAWSVELPGKDSIYAISDTDGSAVATLITGLETGN
jgi:hypothetical protein